MPRLQELPRMGQLPSAETSSSDLIPSEGLMLRLRIVGGMQGQRQPLLRSKTKQSN